MAQQQERDEPQKQVEEVSEQQAVRRDFLMDQYQDVFKRNSQLSINHAFYLESTRLHINAVILQSKIEEVKAEVHRLKMILGSENTERKRAVHNSCSQPISDDSNSDKRKRVRRTANQIARHYECTVEKCHKSYGSEGSLNQHMKLKHPELHAKNSQYMGFQ